MARMKKRAIIYAATVEVLCPHCGEPQPCPDNGSHLWPISMAQKADTNHTCNACDEKFQVFIFEKVQVPLP